MEPKRSSEFYCDGFEAPDPAEIQRIFEEKGSIFNWGGVKIVRLSSDLVVKFGGHVTIQEAKNMSFVAHRTKDFPVPKVFGYYTFGPFPRDAEFEYIYDSYIFMSFVDGETLEKGWETYTDAVKEGIASQLRRHLTELRDIPSMPWIGSVNGSALNDMLLSRPADSKGPFDSEADFNRALVNAYQRALPRSYIRSFFSGLLSQKKHRTIFTHGDLRPANILVKDGIVTGIVDWEYSGWYPEYWESARAFYIWRWQNDWADYLLTALKPYYEEKVYRVPGLDRPRSSLLIWLKEDDLGPSHFDDSDGRYCLLHNAEAALNDATLLGKLMRVYASEFVKASFDEMKNHFETT